MTNFYDNIFNPAMLQIEFVDLGKTSRQIAREYHASRKIVNALLVQYNIIKRSELEDNDLP